MTSYGSRETERLIYTVVKFRHELLFLFREILAKMSMQSQFKSIPNRYINLSIFSGTFWANYSQNKAWFVPSASLSFCLFKSASNFRFISSCFSLCASCRFLCNSAWWRRSSISLLLFKHCWLSSLFLRRQSSSIVFSSYNIFMKKKIWDFHVVNYKLG